MHFDIGSTTDKDKETTKASLAPIDSNHIGISMHNLRLIFERNGEVCLLPLPHQNMVTFIGMPRRRQMLCTLRQDDRFIALTRTMNLMSWNVISGALESSIVVSDEL